jgi:hypothetical protein
VAAQAVSGASLALAQPGGGYDLHWNKPAAGDGAMSGANGYTLNSTDAQAEAGASNGANGYVVRGKFRNRFEARP